MHTNQKSKLITLVLIGLAILSLTAMSAFAVEVRAVARCGDGGVWVGADTWIKRYNPAGALVAARNVGFDVNKLTFGNLAMNEVWAGYGTRIGRFNAVGVFLGGANLPFNVTALAPCWDDHGVWAGFDTFMQKFSPFGAPVTIRIDPGPGLPVEALTYSADASGVWAGYGPIIRRGTPAGPVIGPVGLPDSITALCPAPASEVWAGYDTFIEKHNAAGALAFGPINFGRNVAAIARVSDAGDFWVGSGTFITRLTPAGGVVGSVNCGLEVKDLTAAPDLGIWVALDNEVRKYSAFGVLLVRIFP
jgi:hypothetical protein